MDKEFSSLAFLDELLSTNWQLSNQIKEGIKQVKKELEDAKEFDFRQLGDHLYDGIYLSDGNGTTLYVNKSYTRITGIKAEEVIGRNVKDLLAEGVYKNAVTLEVIKQKKQVNSMGESTRNGKKMLITGNPIFDENGEVKQVVIIDREITDLLAMKAEIENSQKQIMAVEEDKNKKKRELEHLRKQQLNHNFIGQSLDMQKMKKLIQQVSNLDVTILITGETGTGKEVVANEIYSNSLRKNGPFIKVNCAAIPANLLEAELFGYEKGAFTGATSSGKIGLFELADKGTILLDEIGDMPMELQSKLLRVIQHKEVTRIGGSKPLLLDVRIIAATNCDLKELADKGKFREDLYYRLNVVPVHLPPLRQRASDIELLARHFLASYNTKYAKQTTIEESAIELLKQYSWPGNIRELQNISERLVIISEPGSTISEQQIVSMINVGAVYGNIINKEMSLKEIVENIEKKTIEQALLHYGSTRKAAKILKVDQSTIVKKAKKLGIRFTDEKQHQI
ncbi:sigma 54-interacting transcriptional regulator [Anaerospora sp.]|jgi:PAS domain S-box-containing protein|uniref:sigma-54 interaction domain-containing protein n=1 Tax=Anaerospora sp. TaxID=1960278 RepID=UPI002897691E|nr:sigma 54-interacting transcriptional regulator [Anaerospora sp.]